MVTYLALQTLSLASLQACHRNKGNKYFKQCNIVKNPIWQTRWLFYSVTGDLFFVVGVHTIAYAYPNVKIVTAAVDPEVNDKFHIIPGIGT